MKYNPGTIKGNQYIKKVSFSKAVLWKDKQLSLRENVIQGLVSREIKEIVFQDVRKKEEWIFQVKDVVENMILKVVGQEPQFYFPIELAKKIKIDSKPKVQYQIVTIDGVQVAVVKNN